ncbi:DUF4062 domain-containing protein [Flavobacterium sp. N3904]|uniref:DUF4062 domain-containing protein n=1 Tax=Flavobacterium sp. N3904 TaxID=2986835 RepID=UPI0022248DF0|nr:DUF4062 domain-containing protein [Flavobacterium sp. N3904]
MKIFLSSTCYDLVDIRAELERFLKEKGHELLLSDRATFPVEIGIHRHDVCINNVQNCDLFILIVDGRFGAPYYKDENLSITWAEFNEALRTERKIIPFVRKDVFNERQSYRHNLKKGNSFEPFFADTIRVFDLMGEIQRHEGGFWIEQFENSVEIKDRLENLIKTGHSFLNVGPQAIVSYYDQIPLTEVSGSTASYITKFVTNDKVEAINEELLNKAISSIPEGTKPFGELLGFEQIPGGNDYYYYRPMKHSGDEGEIIIGITPTALGDAVRKELIDLKANLKNKNGG